MVSGRPMLLNLGAPAAQNAYLVVAHKKLEQHPAVYIDWTDFVGTFVTMMVRC